MRIFDPAGPLPTGTAVLEASAGTGKTHAIAALAVRYLAEASVDAAGLTVITFSRAATQELRHRLLQRVRATAALLGQALADGPRPSGVDTADEVLLTGTKADLRERQARLLRAIAAFDQVTVMTIHEFCQAMLHELGVLAEADPTATLVEDLSVLREEAVSDLYLRRYADRADPPPFTLGEARSIAREAVARPDAALAPVDADGVSAERVAFAGAVRDEVALRKRRLGVYSFDDQLERLRDALVGPVGAPARERLRRRCPVVLVDEFQDTDPVQWQILRDAFAGHSALVLIGDPKQAIYSFRGADVAAYQQAVQVAGETERQSLAVNYRADSPVVAALDEFFAGAELGAGIPVPPVRAHHEGSRLVLPSDSPWRPPVRIRTVNAAEPMWIWDARRQVNADLVTEVRALLAAGAQVHTADGARKLHPGDIAILVRTNARGQALVRELGRAGVAAAFSGSDSVFASMAATSWLTLLRALHEPRRANVRAAVLTDFVGASMAELAGASEQQLADWAGLVARWSRVHRSEGLPALFVALQADGGFACRVRSRALGARDLTDYRHVAEVLHEQERTGLSLGALVDWLAESIADPVLAGERTRRLETDAAAVQIMTIHKAKGLQFPVVLLPDAADRPIAEDKGQALVFHDETGARQLDVGAPDAPGRTTRWAANQEEEAADSLRTLYVAATRAQSQLTMWWARTSTHTATSSLHRILFRRRDLDGEPAQAYSVEEPPGDGDPAALAWLAEAGIAVQAAEPTGANEAALRPSAPSELATAVWRREIDRAWRRTSYSGLTAAVHALPPPPAAGVVEDEAEPGEGGVPTAPGPRSPMADLPGGTAFGTCVHQVFESLDWYAPLAADVPALHERLVAECAEAIATNPVSVTADALAEALLPGLLTPLGPLTGDRPLVALPVTDRLNELEFELPLGSGSRRATLRDLAAVLASGLPPDDPLTGYPELLTDPALADQVLLGFLTGSIDAVLRVPGPAGPRFVVVDYKTNRISAEPELLQTHFGQTAMTGEMLRSHYPLQALLYQVALHRFLARRLPGYRPELHLGGAGYLFVRGLGGPEPMLDGGLPTGVFAWQPPATTVVAVSRLLDGGGGDA